MLSNEKSDTEGVFRQACSLKLHGFADFGGQLALECTAACS